MDYKVRSVAVAIGVLALQSPLASAAVIFDQTVDLTAGVFNSDFALPPQATDDFQLQPGASTISGIHWWGGYLSTPLAVDRFTIRIFADDAGAPAVNPLAQFDVGHVGRIDTGAEANNLDIYAYSVDITPLALMADVTYWLSIVNDSTGSGGEHYWKWSTEPGEGNSQARAQDGQDWSEYNGKLGFRLTNDATEVAEPGTLALLGLGLAGIGFQLRGRRTI